MKNGAVSMVKILNQAGMYAHNQAVVIHSVLVRTLISKILWDRNKKDFREDVKEADIKLIEVIQDVGKIKNSITQGIKLNKDGGKVKKIKPLGIKFKDIGKVKITITQGIKTLTKGIKIPKVVLMEGEGRNGLTVNAILLSFCKSFNILFYWYLQPIYISIGFISSIITRLQPISCFLFTLQ